MPLHVVEEDALSLDEPLVLLARHVRADEAGLRLGLLDNQRFADLGHCATALIASTISAGETMFPPRAPFFTAALGRTDA